MGSSGDARPGQGPGPAVERKVVPGGFLLTVSGAIDERFDQRALCEGLSGAVVIDLDRVHRITSFGIREWIRGLKALKADYCGFVRCRPSTVAQFNTVANFGGRGQLVSFYGRYLCRACGHEFEHLIDLRQHHEQVKAFTPPPANCPKCQALAEFDDVAVDYFAFAAAEPAPSPPPSVEALLDGVVSAVPFRVRKEVSGLVTALSLSGALNESARFKRAFDGLEGVVSVNLSQVTAVSPAGLLALREALELEGPGLWLTGLPPVLFGPLAADPTLKGRAAVTSVLLTFVCPQCRHLAQLELGARGLERLGAGESCPRCGARMDVTTEHLAAVSALGLVESPPELVGLQGAAGPEAEKPKTFGRYQLVRPLGIGGMAEVFLARQTGVGGFEKKVVLKRILPHLAQDQHFVSMLLHEARVAARISHPNVVQTIDVGQTDGEFYIAMEYVKGWDLSALLRLCALVQTPFPIGLACRVAAEICAGLHAAHRSVDDQGLLLQIIHRDVSPHNVLLSTGGEVKLTDFGIAKAADSSDSLTPTESLKGKLAWLAPEQVNPALGPTDARADLFPTGLVLLQCLTLQQPFRRDTDLATLNAILYEPVPRLAALRPEAPERLQQVLDGALARLLDERYPDAGRMRDDLEQVMVALGEPATASDLAAWLHQLVGRAQANGQLSPDGAFTPTTPSKK